MRPTRTLALPWAASSPISVVPLPEASSERHLKD